MPKADKHKKLLIILDAHAILHRAFHALPAFSSPAGEPTGAVYGFTTTLLRIIREFSPDYIAAAFDLPVPTFRHVAYEKYKAQRWHEQHREIMDLELASWLNGKRG